MLILQNVNGSKAVDVRKNRFDGGTGSVPLVFDPAAMMYREKGSEPIRGGIASLLSARDVDGDTLAGPRTVGGAAAVSAAGARAALQALGLVAPDQVSETAAPPGTHAHVAATSSAAAAVPAAAVPPSRAPAAELKSIAEPVTADPVAAEPTATPPAVSKPAASGAEAPAVRAEPEGRAEPNGAGKTAMAEPSSDSSSGLAQQGAGRGAGAATKAAPAAPAPKQEVPKRQVRRAAVPGGAYAVAGAVPAVRRSLPHSASTVIVDGEEDFGLAEPDVVSTEVTTEWPEDDILTG